MFLIRIWIDPYNDRGAYWQHDCWRANLAEAAVLAKLYDRAIVMDLRRPIGDGRFYVCSYHGW